MVADKFDRKTATAVVVLAIAQIIGWGTVSMPAVVAQKLADDLHIDLSTVFIGSSILYFTMGMCGPALAKFFTSYGARRLMIVGTAISAVGFGMLSEARALNVYFASWFVLGLGGSASLTTAAHIMLNEVAGKQSASAISTLMLATGLYATVFWPIIGLLDGLFGWRVMCEIFVGLLLFISLPLYALGLPPKIQIEQRPGSPGKVKIDQPIHDKGVLYFVVGSIILNAFITYGFSTIFIELLKSEGLPESQAIMFGSALGVVQIGARVVNWVGGKQWDGVSIGMTSTAALIASMVLLIFNHGSYLATVLFVALYGLGSGALAVARSTIPLAFYDKAAFTKAISRIALPLNLFSAVSPPFLVELMGRYGANGVLSAAVLSSTGALLCLIVLSRRRPATRELPQS